MQLVIVRGQPVRVPGRRSGRAGLRTDRQRAELVEREHPVREVVHDLLDTGELGLFGGVVGLLPRLRPLEGEVAFAQQLPQSFPTDLDAVGAVVVGEVVGEFSAGSSG